VLACFPVFGPIIAGKFQFMNCSPSLDHPCRLFPARAGITGCLQIHCAASGTTDRSNQGRAYAPDLAIAYEAADPAKLHAWLDGLIPNAPCCARRRSACQGLGAGMERRRPNG